jgi:hypothetical protein
MLLGLAWLRRKRSLVKPHIGVVGLRYFEFRDSFYINGLSAIAEAILMDSKKVDAAHKMLMGVKLTAPSERGLLVEAVIIYPTGATVFDTFCWI